MNRARSADPCPGGNDGRGEDSANPLQKHENREDAAGINSEAVPLLLDQFRDGGRVQRWLASWFFVHPVSSSQPNTGLVPAVVEWLVMILNTAAKPELSPRWPRDPVMPPEKRRWPSGT